ncbi:MAG: phosphoglycerate dehydrogenase [Omnitrophica bacterium RBG_13_46_9]|nr:MAG: phosphoglycerate dehydrogenase [Omnitrophica bacterium RBG_13_46_9]
MASKILISDPLAEEGIKILREEKDFTVDSKPKLPPEELKKIVGEYDALIVRSETKVTKDILKSAKKLKYIGRAGVGLDNVDVDEASKMGIIVMNAPGGNMVSTAEHTLSLILSLSRNIPQADASLKKGEWSRKKFMGVELYGKTLGIIGLGRIGTEVARRALSFQMKVIACDPYLIPEKAKSLGIESVDLDTLFKASDYITVHTPLTEDTRHVIDANAFKKMKKGVRIINCARGGIIDEGALGEGIESGIVAGAALDVYENEPPGQSKLVCMDKVVTTPHLGASTEEAQVNVSVDIAQSIRDAIMRRGIRNAVNIPCIEPELFKIIEPYLNLAEKIGSMHAQLQEGSVSKIKIKYVGDIVQYDLNHMTRSIVKGLLGRTLEESVNYVNALVVSKERGIKITEEKTKEVEDFANLIIVEVQTSKTKNSIMGTLFTKIDPRIVKINQFYVDAFPEGHMLVIYNTDKPGIVGQIGTLLGKNNINIAGMNFGRTKRGGDAITLLNIDSAVPEKVLGKIKKMRYIKEVKYVKL